MSTIYIAEPGGQQATYLEEQARALWSGGGISPQALYWKEGMPDWRPAAEFFAGPGLMAGRAAASYAPARAPRGFAKEPTTLTGFLKVMLWITLGLSSTGVLLAILSLATGNAAQALEDELTATDVAEALLGLAQLAVFIVTGVVFLMWIHRANRNARALGAEGMTFTPGWSVGWYFVPILCLWKPYQAMKEIWQASQNPRAWTTQEVSPIVSRWWALWLLSNFLGQLALRLAFRAETPSALMNSEIVSLLSDLVDIPLCLAAIQLVTGIYRMQCEQAQRPV